MDSNVRLASFTDYGLRMLKRMASTPDRGYSTADLAQEFGLPRNHLGKIMQRLSREGTVETRRGGGGGAMLAKPPQNVKLGDVERSLEADQPLFECFGAVMRPEYAAPLIAVSHDVATHFATIAAANAYWKDVK